VNDLTKPERIQLEELETVISNGIQTFAEVGNALLAIREAKLYRAEYKTFELYCKEKWGFTDRRARMIIAASETVETIGKTGTIVPKSEAVARPLTKLPASEQPAAWKAATDKAQAEGRNVRARDTEEAVEEKRAKEGAAKPATDERKGPTKGIRLASEAIACLSRIPRNDRTRAEAWSMVSNWLKANK